MTARNLSVAEVERIAETPDQRHERTSGCLGMVGEHLQHEG